MKSRFGWIAAGAAFGCTFSLTGGALAAGTALDIQSGRGTGMAAAMTGHVDDSSAIFYNPAGIARGKVIDAQLGATLIAPGLGYTDLAGNKTKATSSAILPPNAYFMAGITDDLAAGVGLFVPFGNAINWPSNFAGRNIASEVSLTVLDINPTVAYRIGPVRVGAGLQIAPATVRLKKRINFGTTEGEVDVGGASLGWGGNVGVQVDAIQKYLTFGLHYRSAVKNSFDDGKGHFSNVPLPLAGTLHDQLVTTNLVNPETITFGISSRPIDALLIDLDIGWYNWSRLKSVDINFPNDTSRTAENPNGTLSSSQPKNWSNTVNVHLGAEGIVHKNWRVRGGIMYDPTPSPESTLTPDLPDSNRINIAAGGSYVHDTGFRVDLGYQYITFLSNKSTWPSLPGEYGGDVHILGLNLGYRTPAPSNGPPPPMPVDATVPAPSNEPPPASSTPATPAEPSTAPTPANPTP